MVIAQFISKVVESIDVIVLTMHIEIHCWQYFGFDVSAYGSLAENNNNKNDNNHQSLKP